MKLANQLVSIFCEIDDFCKEFNEHMENKLLPELNEKGKRYYPCNLVYSTQQRKANLSKGLKLITRKRKNMKKTLFFCSRKTIA